ncbi:MAG: restriction endonuclease subunit S [Verrucomicrobiota bacterium]
MPKLPTAKTLTNAPPMNGWRRVKFGDVVECVNDTVADPQAAGVERVVGLDHLDPGSLHIKRWASIEDGTTFTRRFKSGQVLFGKRRAYQRKLAVADFDGICSGAILGLEPKADDLIPELLPFIMQTEDFWQHALDTSAGSLSPRTKWQDLARYELAFPPKEEQRRIADILWAADAHLESLKDCAKTIVALREAVLDSELASAGMKKALLSELLLFIEYGCSKRSSSNVDSGLPIVGIPNVVGGAINSKNLHRVELTKEEIKRFSLKCGDILVVRTNGNPDYVGRGAVVPLFTETTVFASYLLRLRFDTDKVLPEFGHAVLQSKRFRQSVRKEVKSSAGNFNLNTQGLKKQEMPLLSLSDQALVISKLKCVEDSLGACLNQQQTAKELKARLIASLIPPSIEV